MAINFNDAITRLSQQKQALSGRAPSRNEIAGLVEGVAAGANERLTQSKQLDIQQQGQDLNVQKLAEEKRLADTEIQFAHDAAKRDIDARRQETGAGVGALVGTGVGYYFGGPVGGVVVSAVGSMLGKVASGNSWICSALHEKEPWTISQQKALFKLFKHAHENHTEAFSCYQEIGPELARHGQKNDVLEIIKIVQAGETERAYEGYMAMCKQIITEHMPELLSVYEEARRAA